MRPAPIRTRTSNKIRHDELLLLRGGVMLSTDVSGGSSEGSGGKLLVSNVSAFSSCGLGGCVSAGFSEFGGGLFSESGDPSFIFT